MKHTGKTLASISIIGHLCFLFILIAEHFIRTELPPASHYLSEYSLGPNGWIHLSAFTVLTIAQIALFAGLLKHIKASWLSLFTWVVYTIALVLVIVFFTDKPGNEPNLAGQIHGWAALIGFLFFIIGMITWGFDFKKKTYWHPMAKLSAITSVFAVAIFVSSFFIPASIAGLVQRLLVVCNLCWLLPVSWHLYKASRA